MEGKEERKVTEGEGGGEGKGGGKGNEGGDNEERKGGK